MNREGYYALFAGTRFEIGNAIPEIRQCRPRDLNQRTANRAVCFVDWLNIRGVSRGSSVALSSTDHNHHHMQGSGAPEMQERRWPWEHQCRSQRHHCSVCRTTRCVALRCRGGGEDSGRRYSRSLQSIAETNAGAGEERGTHFSRRKPTRMGSL